MATRSFEHANVTIGFRKGRPSVKAKNEESAIEWLKNTFGGFFLRLKPELDREAIKSAIENGTDNMIDPSYTASGFESLVADHGITLSKPKDKFFCDVKEQK